MNRSMKVAASGVLLWIALAMAPGARAASVSYFLDQSNALPDGNDYLKVTIDDEGSAGAINFTVDVLSALTPGSNFGIQKFSFNGSHLSASNIVFTGASADGWQVANNNGAMSEFGKFSNVLAATGNHRTDPLTFSIVGIEGDDINDYVQDNPFFAAHVADFVADGITSAYFGGGISTPVPLPPAAWLFGSGLPGLIGVARRKRVNAHKETED